VKLNGRISSVEVENPLFRNLFMFFTPKYVEGVKFVAYFGVVGKLIPTFLIHVH